MNILAIETSCDETAIAIIKISGPKTRPSIKILSNIVASQIKLHAKFGGVVPNLAKREHQRNLTPVLLAALREANLSNSKNAPSPKPLSVSDKKRSVAKAIERQRQKSKSQFKIQNNINKILEREPELLKRFLKHILSLEVPEIDAIAVTIGPGLAPALWVGVNFARALVCLWQKPLIPVNHMEGHFFSALLEQKGPDDSKLKISALNFPALALLVSGGHTELVLTKRIGKYKIVGETLDDAAGEAFDKAARLLGLPYPGGPAISALTERKIRISVPKIPEIKLPRPMLNSKDYNFSFSGLKTAVFYLVRDLTKNYSMEKIRPVVAKEFQKAVIDVLVTKTIRAAIKYKINTVLLGGGVAANKLLRKTLAEKIKKNLPLTTCRLPLTSITGDNALMIGLAAYFTGEKKGWRTIKANANMRL